MKTTAIRCGCGAVEGKVTVKRWSGWRTTCHCVLCHRAAARLGRPHDREAGIELFQTTPDRIEITKGIEHLTAAQVSPNDMIRWVAGCCDTFLVMTHPHPRLALAGVAVDCCDDPSVFPEPVIHTFIETGPRKWKHSRAVAFPAGILGRAVSSAVTGRWKRSPFRDASTGGPIRVPRMWPKG